MKAWLVALVLLVACAKAPPNLSPEGVTLWQANEATVIIGTMQHLAIELNKTQMCTVPIPVSNCRPLLSDRNTGVVVDASTDALLTLQAAPSGWRATTSAALDRIAMRLDSNGRTKLAGYLQAARQAVEVIP